MTVKKGLIEFRDADLRVPLAEGETVPCPKCGGRHTVLRDPRPGRRYSSETGQVDLVRNDVLYVECPDAPGPIVVGINGKALQTPLELTPRAKTP
jgi:hypothetical protein